MDYITLVKGDDTNFVDDQYIKIKFVTDLDFTGFTGYFTLGGVTLNYTNISSKVINVVLNNSFTSALIVGKQYAELKLKDNQNRYRTITSVIPIKVVDVVTVQPTYVNNVIECHSDVNNTTIEVKIETAGIAQSTADEYVTTMNSILTQTQSKANEASSSAVNARTSEVNAKSYMDYAKDYKDLANTSAGNAATSATFAEETVNGFDTHVAGKQSDFDSNATNKTDTFNSNATSKTETFNANATSKTNDFNTNYNTKKLAIDNAVIQAQRYATGTPSEPDGYSAKYWAERASQGQMQADWTQDDNTKPDYIKNKPALKTVATSGSYNDLDDKPTIPTVPTVLSSFVDDLGNSPVHTHSQYENTTNKGVANGYAELDNTGKVPTSQLPKINSTMLNLKFNLMKANGKKVQFICSEGAPVTIDFLDGTQKTFSYLPDYDMSNLGNGTYPIATNKASMTFASGRIGNLPIDTNGNASGFAQGRYIYWGAAEGSFSQLVQGKTWEVVAKFTTGNDVTPEQGIVGGDSGTFLPDMPSLADSHFCLNLSSNGTSYDIATAVGTYTVLPNTTYWTRTRFTGTQYIFEYSLDGTNYITDITVNSSTSIENTPDSLTIGARAGKYFKGSIDLNNTKAYANDTLIIDANWFATDSEYLGMVTLTADGITKITNNYQTEAINPLEEVTVHTKESYAKVTENLPTNLDLIPFTFVDLDYSSYETVSADTSYTLTKDVMVNTNSISTFTITKEGANYTVYGTWLPVRAGTMFKSSVAGKYYSFEGY